MGLRSTAPASVRRALAAAAVLTLATACGDPKEPSPAPGVITVSGSERLGWNQAGDPAFLKFRAYVDGGPVDLNAAACDGATPEATCSSPLPPLTNGTHTIALTAVDKYSGAESERSAPITVQKVSGTSTIGAIPFAAPGGGRGSLGVETVAATADGLIFAVEIVAAGVKAPAQLAWSPDGRLFLAEADGRVRVVYPGEGSSGELAFDAGAILEPPPAGPLGLTLHPDFQRNHFVYVSFLTRDSRERTLLRLIRLREVGDTLGETATLFEAPLTGVALDEFRDGPRLAFGPDRLLYIALPAGVEFDGEPAASGPVAAMLRLRDDGRVPLELPALEGVRASPIGFDWHPTTGALWAVFPGDGSEAVMRRVAEEDASGAAEGGDVRLRLEAGGGRASGALRFQRVRESQLDPVRAFVAVPGNEELGVLTFIDPVRKGDLLTGLLGRVGDIVEGDGATLYLATRNGDAARGGEGSTGDVVVRLTRRAK